MLNLSSISVVLLTCFTLCRDVSTPAPAAASGPMDLNTAIQEVLKHADVSDGLARGIRKAVQALDRLVPHP